MEKFNETLTWAILWIMLFGAALFIFTDIPKTNKLQNYKRARYLLTAVYLLMAVANFIQLLGGKDDAVWYSRIVTLWIGCSMASTLTIVNITLINLYFFSYKKFLIELIHPFIFTITTLLCFSYLGEKSTFFIISYSLFLIYYIYLMVKYTYMLSKEYQKYKAKFDNYYSESEFDHLKWIWKTQIIAISCGILAFISLFLPLCFVCFFSFYLIFFYIYYAIRFINYPSTFSVIEAIVEESSADLTTNTTTFNQLENAVKLWEIKKTFVSNEINIELVAKDLWTNRTYLSNYINTYKKMSFKEWISDLRINEAKQLLLSEPQTSIGEIGYRVGFSDKSNFTNRFIKNVGESPKKWREKNLKHPNSRHLSNNSL